MLCGRNPILVAMVFAVALFARLTPTATAQTLTKQFTYQGYLEQDGSPHTGTVNLRFTLYSQPTGPNPSVGLRDQLVLTDVPVNRGVFTVMLNFGETDLFGAQIYDGRPLYLEIATQIGTGPTSTLTPRQLVQPTPIALSMPNITPVGANVGIGTTSPSAKLHVTDNAPNLLALQGSSGFGTYLSLNNTSTGGENWAFISTGQSNGEGAGKLLIADQFPRLTIDTNGNVGIGTISPTDRLTVNGTSRVTGAMVVEGQTTGVGRIRYASNTTANALTFDILSGASIDLISNSDLYVAARGARNHILLNADAGLGNVGIGTANPTEKLHVSGNIRANVIIIDGGADLAESYDVAKHGELKPAAGMVVTIDPEHVGKLRIATTAYDKAVAGIISGADGVAPGLVLGQRGTVADGELPIANVGRVWCFVDADAGGAVIAGDLLTTSPTPGHAMKASDQSRTSGAVLGKAMSPLKSGKGKVLVLVSLQ